MYKLGIKRRFWFGYRWHTVIGHATEVIGFGARLVLTFPDGIKVAIPQIHKRQVCTYPEYREPAQSPPEPHFTEG